MIENAIQIRDVRFMLLLTITRRWVAVVQIVERHGWVDAEPGPSKGQYGIECKERS